MTPGLCIPRGELVEVSPGVSPTGFTSIAVWRGAQASAVRVASGVGQPGSLPPGLWGRLGRPCGTWRQPPPGRSLRCACAGPSARSNMLSSYKGSLFRRCCVSGRIPSKTGVCICLSGLEVCAPALRMGSGAAPHPRLRERALSTWERSGSREPLYLCNQGCPLHSAHIVTALTGFNSCGPEL
jgi:hypothetical protein